MHKVFTEEINKITLSSNDDNLVIWFNKTYACGTSKDLVSEKKRLNATIW